MGDIKVKSMRLNEEDIASFEKFAEENGFTQQQAFATLISLGELEKTKGILGERGKEIEAFQATINKLLNFYVTSLDINATTEETVRAAMDKELALKDKVISEQLSKNTELKEEVSSLKESLKSNLEEKDNIQGRLWNAEKELQAKDKNIEKLNNANDLLQEQLKEYKSFKDINKKLSSDLAESSEHINKLKEELNNSQNENIKLQDKINNYTDILTFYKEQLEKDESNLASLKAEHKASNEMIESRHKLELEAMTKRHDRELKELEERLQERKDLELSKKDLEIKELQGLVDKFQGNSGKSS